MDAAGRAAHLQGMTTTTGRTTAAHLEFDYVIVTCEPTPTTTLARPGAWLAGFLVTSAVVVASLAGGMTRFGFDPMVVLAVVGAFLVLTATVPALRVARKTQAGRR